MSIRVAVRHTTSYRFDRHVAIAPHILRLRPAPHCRNRIYSYSLKVKPQQHFINWQQDPFGNFLARLVFPEKQDHLTVEVEIITDMTVINPFDFFVEEYAEHYPFSYEAQSRAELAPYLEVTEEGPLLRQWLAGVPGVKTPIIDFLVLLNQRLQRDIAYNVRMEPGVQRCEETLSLARGSCRDSGWLLVQILRHLGLAARFCSGYLVQLAPDTRSLDGPSGPTADFTDLHAWCEVYLPGAGWVGLDPTSGLFAGESHIPLACTPSPVSAAPITGATDPCQVDFSYRNEVHRIHEDPRVTKPYSEPQWAAIVALGEAVDRELAEGDVRLTMGGEPTFVSIDDMDDPQWNITAMGEHKLKLAKDLLIRLRDHFAPGGLLHYGQGKWYPGEPTPRWALGCFWRTDGRPLWRRSELLARVDRDYGLTLEDARRFIGELAGRLGLAASFIQPAYEDALYHVWKEQQVPAELDPARADLGDSLERRRLAKLLNRGLNEPAGYTLPLQRQEGEPWRSSQWLMRAERINLVPGDSPMGLRLPLDSLLPPESGELEPYRDPFAPRAPLAEAKAQSADADRDGESADAGDAAPSEPGEKQGTSGIVRTTLCLEPRDGRLYIFLPPLEYLEHFIELVGEIEAVAAALALPVVVEGYEPPRDPRLQRLLVTPDPGVIEVNIHPAGSWRELVDNTMVLYEEARQARLGTEKFMLDGRHSGTGGGNHVTLGGERPEDSPLLRRPDLLQSLVTYWQHHPGLSYLFSGLFLGPTSQAPRVDEGRSEMLYELEIAFSQFPEGEVPEPWLVDRLLRNLLIDITGNTHRAEFCIDKLYAPGSASGRQGILEFRGFEMPPHAHMALVQVLLLRCLVARFWKAPYRSKLVRWGTLLHDKFMMPHYVWADIREVVEELNRHGYPFRLEWLAPFEEFRFPHYGNMSIGDIQLELRWAIEPWHVLGEEVSSFGTSRYVDSSVERLQVKLSGLTPERYVLACNGRRVPLRATGRHGEYVAAVRYRAWQPPSALHPRIGVHSPLVFDLVDCWNGRSIGGCTYHVSHPGGRSYDTFPVNAFEAESRRVSRFWPFGHTQSSLPPQPELDSIREMFPNQQPPHPMEPPPEEPSAEYPHTLDLRRPMAAPE
jgi:uncharacterized protein (DUF2126 family)/transglutaminase-like putative cysteine protease